MPVLSGGTERVNLGSDYVLVAPGLRGRADRLTAASGAVRSSGDASPILTEKLANAGMTTIADIEIRATTVPTTAAGDLRDTRGDDALLLEVPDLGQQTGQVVLAVDEAGALTWHFPTDAGQIQPPAVRGNAGKKRFVIRRRVAPVPPPETARDRALFGSIGRKLLKVIVYPVTDLLLGAPASAIAEYWEKANRLYGLRLFAPDNYRSPTDKSEPSPLGGTSLSRLAEGPALLFIHGTFSTAHGAFHDLPPEFVKELHNRYGGRMFAFNHYTLAHDPEKNVRWFVDAMRPVTTSKTLDVDIVCHSRGGLVARTLAEGKGAFGIDLDRIRVRRIVFVGVPNQGTLLADPDHMVEMIDRMTTALNAVPPGGFADVLEGILIAVKIIGHGALNGLAGLGSMHPTGPFLKKLNQFGKPDVEYFACAANFEPTDLAIRSLVSRSANVLIDRVFEQAENDLVVPETGVYDKNGSASFPIAAERCLRIPASAGVMHTSMFGHRELVDRLNVWLQ